MADSGRVLRVFPRRTSYTPGDDLVRVGEPDLFGIPADVCEIHVSCTFTWDRSEAERLVSAWRRVGLLVRIGGPAYDDPGADFTPGIYTRPGVTITSRGCPERCPWCFVPRREGALRLLPITPGHIVNDNNILACPHDHFEAVCRMLGERQRAAVFAGGLSAVRLTDRHVEHLRGLRINELWFAADCDGAIGPLERAVAKVAALGRQKLRCYVLVGFGGDTPGKAEERLERVWAAGCLPFAQFYRAEDGKRTPPIEWRRLLKKWARPAAMVAAHTRKETTCG